ncbi:tetratricopeptide repeat protein [Pseudorhodoferax sp. Leaf267]|uniref:tetratricopeptide repeat protein n=1 Tax=Pseudorhodoferax sp. Leaf267 TaxID=1736316 RepID=UPI000B2AB43B|nr:tetratricopeptide repeat protein [Pseudorhodoferax sp. Leaf267]
MLRLLRPAARGLASLTLLLGLLPGHAQGPAATPSNEASTTSSPAQSGLTSELFYELLIGEMNVASGEPGVGYSLVLDSAVKAKDPLLFQRAVEIALQSRSLDAAQRAARAWRDAVPDSREANRALLQILIATNRIADTMEPLRTEIAGTPPMERNAAILAIPRAYARATDRQLTLQVVEQALAAFVDDKTTGASAWTTIGRLRLANSDTAGALDAAARGQAIEPGAEGPAVLALEMMDRRQPRAEEILKRHLQGKPSPQLRLAYVRAQLDEQRYAEASAQLQQLTTEQPDFAEAWLVLGTMQAQDNRLAEADASIQRFISLAQQQPQSEQRSRGLAQAYLALAQTAEKRKDFAAAEKWLNQIENADDLLSAQNRRASLLAKQGRMPEARAMIRALPERNAAEARMKLNAEVQLLRDARQHQDAYDLLQKALERDPKDADLLYEQAMMAEKLGRPDEMERLLRTLIEAKPEYHHAYNALGYSLADRNVRLPEAKQLILKALELVPNDPYIADSLGWVEFRMGNLDEAVRILSNAYKTRPDPEIAAHLGEVLWAAGQRDRAQSIWKEGLAMSADNETLQSTLKRLRAPL